MIATTTKVIVTTSMITMAVVIRITNHKQGEDSQYPMITILIMIATTKVMMTTHSVILFSAGLMIDSNLWTSLSYEACTKYIVNWNVEGYQYGI